MGGLEISEDHFPAVALLHAQSSSSPYTGIQPKPKAALPEKPTAGPDASVAIP